MKGCLSFRATFDEKDALPSAGSSDHASTPQPASHPSSSRRASLSRAGPLDQADRRRAPPQHRDSQAPHPHSFRRSALTPGSKPSPPPEPHHRPDDARARPGNHRARSRDGADRRAGGLPRALTGKRDRDELACRRRGRWQRCSRPARCRRSSGAGRHPSRGRVQLATRETATGGGTRVSSLAETEKRRCAAASETAPARPRTDDGC